MIEMKPFKTKAIDGSDMEPVTCEGCGATRLEVGIAIDEVVVRCTTCDVEWDPNSIDTP